MFYLFTRSKLTIFFCTHQKAKNMKEIFQKTIANFHIHTGVLLKLKLNFVLTFDSLQNRFVEHARA